MILSFELNRFYFTKWNKICSTAQNHTLFIEKKIPKYIPPLLFSADSFYKIIDNIFTQNYSHFLWKTHYILVGNNNLRGRTRPARSGNRVFINYSKKLCDFYILFIYFTEFYFLGCLYYKNSTEFYFVIGLYYSKKSQNIYSPPFIFSRFFL